MSDKTIHPFKRLVNLLNADKKDIHKIYIYSIFIGITNLTLPLGVQAIINFVQTGVISTSWVVLTILVVFGVFLGGILQIEQLKLTEKLQQTIFIKSAFEFSYRIPRFKLSSLKEFYAPELVNRFFDTMTIQKGIPKLLIDFTSASLQLLFGLILLSIYHPFFIIFSIILLATLLFLFVFTSKKGLKTAITESKYKYKVAYWLEELAHSIVSFKMAGNTELHFQKTNELTEKYIKERKNHFKVLLTQYYQLISFKTLTAFLLLVIGGLLVINQQMNIGQFIASEIIILLIISSVEKIILGIENIYDVLAAIDKIGLVTDIETENHPNSPFTSFNNERKALSIDIQDLSFRYASGNFQLQNINLKIAPNEHTLILGNDNSGKTTLLHLLSILQTPNSGNISFNKIPAININPDTLRSQTGVYMSSQNLFNGTIMENITLGKKNIHEDDLLQVCESLHLMDFIKNSKDGFNTVIEPHVHAQSRSISQKILLARSIVHNPNLLLIDDQQRFTSNSLKDVAYLANLLCGESTPWTLIAASKNETWLPFFKKIIKIEDGKIVFEGTKEDYLNNPKK